MPRAKKASDKTSESVNAGDEKTMSSASKLDDQLRGLESKATENSVAGAEAVGGFLSGAVKALVTALNADSTEDEDRVEGLTDILTEEYFYHRLRAQALKRELENQGITVA